MYVKPPEHIQNILDPEIETVIYFTHNTRLLIKRLRDCLGQNLLVYPSSKINLDTSNHLKVGILLVNAGSNMHIFDLHNHFKVRSNKIVYVTSATNTEHDIPNALSCIDSICWTELSPHHQNILKSKLPVLLNNDILEFSDDDYKSLNSNCLVDLISKSYMSLEVFCHLLNNSCQIDTAQELQDPETLVQTSNDLKPGARIYNYQLNSSAFRAPELALEQFLHRMLVDKGILFEYSELEDKTLYEFQTKFHCCWYIGRSLTLNDFDIGDISEKQKQYNRLFGVQIRNVYIRSLCGLLTLDCDDSTQYV